MKLLIRNTLQNQRILIAALLLASVGLGIAGYFFFFPQKAEKGLVTRTEKSETISDVVQLSQQAIQQTGIQTLTVQTRGVSAEIVTTGEVKANENTVFHVSPFVGGRIVKENVILGQSVGQGQTLAVIQNIEVAKANADFIHQLHQNEIDTKQARTRLSLAQKSLERELRLLEEGISPRKDYLQAEADATLAKAELESQREHAVHLKAEARALLGAYGAKPGSPHSEQIKTSSAVTAPRSGMVIKKNVTLGDMVTPDQVMYEVADLSEVWLDIAVYPKDLSRLKVGQSIIFSSDSLPGYPFSGTIRYLQPAASEDSQTFVARAFLNNSSGLLKAGMLGQVKVFLESQTNKPYVSEDAVQRYGRDTFVFKALGRGRFQKQSVQLGDKVGNGYLVNSGLQAGDLIVGKGSFTLKAEMLKSQFAEEE